MKITAYSKLDAMIGKEDEPLEATRNPVKEKKPLLDKLADAGKQVLVALAFGASVIATGCALDMNGKYHLTGDTNNDDPAEVDSGEDAQPDVPDMDSLEDSIDTPDAPDVEVIDDDADVIDDDAFDAETEPDAEEESIEPDGEEVPTCFEVPTPSVDQNPDALLLNSAEHAITFAGPGGTTIDTTTVTKISMTGYPGASLGVCPDDPQSVAFLAAPSAYTVQYDIAVVSGLYSWSATVPYMAGALCGPLTADTAVPASRNMDQQQIPKNASMSGVPTSAGFLLQAIDPSMVVYDLNGIVGSLNTVTVTGSDFSPVQTAKAVAVFSGIETDVEVHAGASSSIYTYTASISGGSSKTARFYPLGTTDSQMYEVLWDESEIIWCSRCIGRESIVIHIPGDLLCKFTDRCSACGGDGFSINIVAVSLDMTLVDYDMWPFYGEAVPPARTATGVSAFSDPSAIHPEVTVTLNRDRTAVGLDLGYAARMTLVVEVELTSEHNGPSGAPEVFGVTIYTAVTDPYAGRPGTPNYTTACGGCTYETP